MWPRRGVPPVSTPWRRSERNEKGAAEIAAAPSSLVDLLRRYSVAGCGGKVFCDFRCGALAGTGVFGGLDEFAIDGAGGNPDPFLMPKSPLSELR